MSILLQLFLVFFQVGLFSIGGGYAAIPVIQNLVVTEKAWMSVEEFTNLITIAEMTPGPISLNASTFVGEQMAGVGGAVVATLGCVVPPLIIISILGFVYFKFSKLSVIKGVFKQLRPVVIGLILASAVTILINSFWGGIEHISLSTTDWMVIVTFVICFILLRIKSFNINPILILVFSGSVGLAFHYVPYLF